MSDPKEHIGLLPVVQYPYNAGSNPELAVSIPLFHSEKDSTCDNFDTDRFQNIHCKGAIWSALSLLYNTDLAAHGVPVYFHIEEKVWEHAKPMFEAFRVPERFIRCVTVPEGEPLPFDMGLTHFGKKWIGLLDAAMDAFEVFLIYDSDCFILAEDTPLPFYRKLTSSLLKARPAMTFFHYREMTYQWWVQVLNMATGRPEKMQGTLNALEQQAYQRLGFEKALGPDYGPEEKVWRIWADDYMLTFPKGHPVRQWTLDNIPTCYCTPYIHSPWSEYNEPFVELKGILGIPVYNWVDDFINRTSSDDRETVHAHLDCMMHARTPLGSEDSRINEYYNDFWNHLSLNISYLSTQAGALDRGTPPKEGTDDRNLLGGEGMPGEIQGYPVKYKSDASVDVTYHCIGIPHLPTFEKQSRNAHAQNVVAVCETLHHSGQRVYHYGHPDSEVACTEHIAVQSRDLFEALYGKRGDVNSTTYNFRDTVYTEFSAVCIRELKDRVHAGDFVILFWGEGHHLIHQALKDMPVHVLSPMFE